MHPSTEPGKEETGRMHGMREEIRKELQRVCIEAGLQQGTGIAGRATPCELTVCFRA